MEDKPSCTIAHGFAILYCIATTTVKVYHVARMVSKIMCVTPIFYSLVIFIAVSMHLAVY